jgi:transcription initiation factor IIE alpha subunit
MTELMVEPGTKLHSVLTALQSKSGLDIPVDELERETKLTHNQVLNNISHLRSRGYNITSKIMQEGSNLYKYDPTGNTQKLRKEIESNWPTYIKIYSKLSTEVGKTVKELCEECNLKPNQVSPVVSKLKNARNVVRAEEKENAEIRTYMYFKYSNLSPAELWDAITKNKNFRESDDDNKPTIVKPKKETRKIEAKQVASVPNLTSNETSEEKDMNVLEQEIKLSEMEIDKLLSLLIEVAGEIEKRANVFKTSIDSISEIMNNKLDSILTRK